ncbi:MAG: PhzF family phenazine biosynthesis protein [Steroidobacteraceae bacterium]
MTRRWLQAVPSRIILLEKAGEPMHTRRDIISLGGLGLAAVIASGESPSIAAARSAHRFHFVQIDVFSSQRLQGNPLAVFTDARGLTDVEMQAIARETNLQETTFILPRDPAVERTQGVKVRIFQSDRELPFAGHPTLGTATVIRKDAMARDSRSATARQVVLDLEVGRIPVAFSNDAAGHVFGEMRQNDPVFGRIHDRETVARLVGIRANDISDEAPIQTVSTGLPFAIVPLKDLRTLRNLHPHQEKIAAYFAHEPGLPWFYYVTRDTQDLAVGLRARGIYPDGEDPATGSAAGCTAAWMVRYGVAFSGKLVHIEQGVEIKRPSHIFVTAERDGEKVYNVRVGGNAIEIAEGEYSL